MPSSNLTFKRNCDIFLHCARIKLENWPLVTYNVFMKIIFRQILIILFLITAILPSFAADDYTVMKKDIIALYNSNNLQDAYLLIAKVPEEQRDADLWLILANITQDYDKELDSIFLLQKAIAVDPTYYKGYYNLGNLYLKDNKIVKAINNYELAIKYNKEFPYSYYNLGICHYKDGNYSKAKFNFLKAIKLKPTEQNFYYNLALTYKKMNNKKMAEKALMSYNALSK